jgi:hypothetical protein
MVLKKENLTLLRQIVWKGETMSETDTNAQTQKLKTSTLATAALLIPVVMWGSGVCIFEIGDRFASNLEVEPGSFWYFLGISAAGLILFSGPVGLGLGIGALNAIKNSKGMLKGRRLAIEGMIVAVALECVFFVFLFAIVAIGG